VRVGVISDTHNLLRPAAVDFLRGSDLVIHAGDICKPEVLDALREIAPVTAVRGNNDKGPWARASQESERIEVGGVVIHVIHDLKELAIDPAAEGVRLVVSGHSHRPTVDERGGVTYLNPGSAGPRRFKLPVSVGEILVRRGRVEVRTVVLET
jgi:putative phosphoesterase